jgi:hypothetical protein
VGGGLNLGGRGVDNDTKTLNTGVYQLRTDTGDGVSRTVNISRK